MFNFDNVEDLVAYMFENVDGEEPISVVANEELAVSIIKELLEYEHVNLKYANVDGWEYDKEYIVTLNDDIDTDDWDIAIEPIYNYEKEMYFGTDGYVLFHEDVNSKAMIDMQNNEFMPLEEHDWFTVGEADVTDETDPNSEREDAAKEDTSDFSLTIEATVDTDEVQKIFEDMERDLRREMVDMLYRPKPFMYMPRIF